MSIYNYFKRDVRIRHLRIVVELEESILLTKAAERLNVSQPALSKTLAEIETALGQTLFDRSRTGLKPTAVGAAFVRAARSVLAQLDKADITISTIANVEQRTLLIGAMPTSGMTLLSQAIHNLQNTQPDVTVRIVDGPTPTLMQQLLAGRLHVVIGANIRQSIPEALEMVNLYEDRMVIVMSQSHPLLGQRQISWDECLAYPWVLPPAAHTMRNAFDERLRQLSLEPPRRIIENQSLDFVLEYMQQAHAFNLMPGLLVQKLVAKGQVKVLSIHGLEDIAISMRVMVLVALSQMGREDVAGLIQSIKKVLKND